MEARMPAKKYHVKLTDEQREYLNNLLARGQARGRELNRARILLKADAGWKDDAIATALDISRPTVERTRKQFVTQGLEAATKRKKPDREYEKALDGRAEAHLVALVCGPVPEGYKQWSMRLLAERLVTLEEVDVESVSHETIRRTLKKMNLSLGNENSG